MDYIKVHISSLLATNSHHMIWSAISETFECPGIPGIRWRRMETVVRQSKVDGGKRAPSRAVSIIGAGIYRSTYSPMGFPMCT